MEIELTGPGSQRLRPGDQVRACHDEPEISTETVGEAWMRRWGLVDPLPAISAGSPATVLAVNDDEIVWQTGDGLVWTSDMDAVELVEPSAASRSGGRG